MFWGNNLPEKLSGTIFWSTRGMIIIFVSYYFKAEAQLHLVVCFALLNLQGVIWLLKGQIKNFPSPQCILNTVPHTGTEKVFYWKTSLKVLSNLFICQLTSKMVQPKCSLDFWAKENAGKLTFQKYRYPELHNFL